MTKIQIKKKRKAYVTIVVLILMMVLLSIVYLYNDALLSELAIARNNKGAQAAFALAEAGVQEAVWRVKYDATTRDKFLNNTGPTTFGHDPALLSNGAYTVTIQNSAPGVATVTAVGSYKIGTLRTARREVRVGIAQDGFEDSYLYDGAIFAAGGSGESIADIGIRDWAKLNVYGGSILSNRDIELRFLSKVNVEKTVEAARNFTNFGPWFWLSEINCNCQIADDGDPLTPQCGDHPGCGVQTNVAKKTLPSVNFDSGPTSYKQQAINQGQYFAKEKDFLDQFPGSYGSSKTFDGVVYIDDSVELYYNRQLTMNGIIATSGSFNVQWGKLQLNPPPDGSGVSGALTQRNFKIDVLGSLIGTGLIYAGDQAEFEIASDSPQFAVNLTGGVISRRTTIRGFRPINLTFNSDVINAPLSPTTLIPVIETNHWEEEY